VTNKTLLIILSSSVSLDAMSAWRLFAHGKLIVAYIGKFVAQ